MASIVNVEETEGGCPLVFVLCVGIGPDEHIWEPLHRNQGSALKFVRNKLQSLRLMRAVRT